MTVMQTGFRFFFATWRVSSLIAALVFSLPTPAAVRTVWVQGSWVNLRAAPSAKAPVVSRLIVNTEASLLAEQGDWCEVAAAAQETRGFMSCKLLGAAPLTLDDIDAKPDANGKLNPRYSPTRAFWLAPSAARLKTAGEHFWSSMLSEAQRSREAYEGNQPDMPEFDEAKPPKIVRYPVPEFDAMKALMKEGVIAAPENRPPFIKWEEILQRVRDSENDPYASVGVSSLWLYDYARKLALAGNITPVRPSFFKRAEELAPRVATIEGLSSQFGITERMRILSGPKWAFFRHDTQRVHGYWDLGSFELTLEKPVVEYVIGRQGLASASQWLPVEKHDITADGSCEEGMDFALRGKMPLAGYPKVKDPLIWIHTPEALPFKKVAVKRFAKRIPPSRSELPAWQRRDLSLVVMHDIDVDGDGIADLAVWEGMPAGGGYGAEVATRLVLANIAGEWFLIEASTYTECT